MIHKRIAYSLCIIPILLSASSAGAARVEAHEALDLIRRPPPAPPLFTRQSVYSWGNAVANVVTGDFDGDHIWDIAVTGDAQDTNRNWYMRYGDGTGQFGRQTEYDWGNGVTNAFAGDFNGDGYFDIGVTGTANDSDRNWYIRYGDGTGQFSNQTVYYWGNGATRVLTGKFDSDDLWDIAVVEFDRRYVGAYAAYIYIQHNLGNGQFGAQTELNWFFLDTDQIIAGDFDGDGLTDLAMTDSDAHPNQGTWYFRRNNGDGTLGPIRTYSWGNNKFNAFTGDFDGDGLYDIGVTGTRANPNNGVWFIRYPH